MSHIKGWQILLVAPLFILTQGCASIIKGTTQPIPIASDPSGADILLDGKAMGQTPKTLALKRKGTYVITIQKPGFEQQSVPIVRNIGGAVWGNAIAGGLIGWGVDAASGAQYNLSPESVSVKLLPVNTTVTGMTTDNSNNLVSELKTLDQMYDARQISGEEYVNTRVALLKKYMPEALPADKAPPAVATPAVDQAPQSK
jgi:PEGA domain